MLEHINVYFWMGQCITLHKGYVTYDRLYDAWCRYIPIHLQRPAFILCTHEQDNPHFSLWKEGCPFTSQKCEHFYLILCKMFNKLFKHHTLLTLIVYISAMTNTNTTHNTWESSMSQKLTFFVFYENSLTDVLKTFKINIRNINDKRFTCLWRSFKKSEKHF